MPQNLNLPWIVPWLPHNIRVLESFMPQSYNSYYLLSILCVRNCSKCFICYKCSVNPYSFKTGLILPKFHSQYVAKPRLVLILSTSGTLTTMLDCLYLNKQILRGSLTCLNSPCIFIFKEVERVHNINLNLLYKLWYLQRAFCFKGGILENLSTSEYYRNKNIIKKRLSDTLVVLFTVLD